MKKLVFVHHSCGKNLLMDDNGGLAKALIDNGYFVSDTYYKWGPEQIGDFTDIGHWWLWFRGPKSELYLNALYSETERHSDYSRQGDAPDGENNIVLFKSCYPNSNMKGHWDDPIPHVQENLLRGQNWKSEHHTVANAKGIYIDLLEYFCIRQDKLFVALTAPPVTDATWSDNARALITGSRRIGYKITLITIWPFSIFFDVLTRNEDGIYSNTLQYPTSTGNDHPNINGNIKAVQEFVPLLNKYYDKWQNTR